MAIVVVGPSLLALIPWWLWQADQRVLVDEAPASPITIAPMLALAFVVFAILVMFGRLIGHGLARIDGWVGRFIPRWAASSSRRPSSSRPSS